MTLVREDISLDGAIFLIQEYEDELYWFAEKLIKETEKRKIINQLDQADLLGIIQGIGYKKGGMNFTKWRRKKILRINEINDELNEDKLTIFERLTKKKEPKTLFDSLIKRYKRK